MTCLLEGGRNENEDISVSFSSRKKTVRPYFKPCGLESVSLTRRIEFDVSISVLKFKTLGTLQV